MDRSGKVSTRFNRPNKTNLLRSQFTRHISRTVEGDEELKKKKKKMAKSMALLVLLFTMFSVAVSIDDKCAACNAVSVELEIGLSKEKPRNHLDMRHRLDSKGQRKGKVIDYRVSELRVVELLDGLCDKMQDYTLEKINSTSQEWIKVHDWNVLTISKQEAKAYANDIATYCGRLLEETEDELAELIKKGSVKAGEMSKVLCQDLSKHCSPSSGSEQVDNDDDDDVESDDDDESAAEL
ncbi:hypothetical protein Q3G72_022519 [Acer saccharum]|nr:hypothetical protein Q3G72_022519 [Acer saccharum]